MRVDGNQVGTPNYFPNSFNGPSVDPKLAWSKCKGTGDVMRYETGDEDNFSQVGIFYRNVLKNDARERLTDNIAGSLAGAQEFIQARAIANFTACDANYGRSVEAKIAGIKKKAGKGSNARATKPAPLNPPRVVPGKSNL